MITSMKSKVNNSVLPRRELITLAAVFACLLLGLLLENKFYINILIDTVYFAVIATAWNIMCGFTGQLSLGHGAFLGLGQYTCVLLYIRMGVTPWVGILAAGCMSMLLACFVGLLALRLKSHFFCLSTIALTMIMQVLVIKMSWLTEGSSGITIKYEPSFGHMIFASSKVNYLMFVFLLVIVLLVTIYIRYTKMGSNLIAIRENEQAAMSLGINLYRNKVIALMLSAFFVSVAGCFYAQHMLFINPTGAFDINLSLKAAIMSIVGGMGTVWGPLVGSLILVPTDILLRANLATVVRGANLIIYGVILVTAILVIPNGIIGTISARIKRKQSLLIEKHIATEEEKG